MKPSDKSNIIVNVDMRYIMALAKVDSKFFYIAR